MKKLFVGVILFVLLGADVALSQVTSVKLEVVQSNEKFLLKITNLRDVPVEALYVTGHLLGPQQPLQRIYYDNHFLWQRDRRPILPGEAVEIGGYSQLNAPDVNLLAIVFADGTTEGDDEPVARILSRRRITLEGLREVKAILQDAIDRKLSVGDAATHIHRAQHAALEGIDKDHWEERGQIEQVFRWAADSLNANARATPDGRATDYEAIMQRFMNKLDVWIADLSGVKPTLPTVSESNQGGTNSNPANSNPQ